MNSQDNIIDNPHVTSSVFERLAGLAARGNFLYTGRDILPNPNKPIKPTKTDSKQKSETNYIDIEIKGVWNI